MVRSSRFVLPGLRPCAFTGQTRTRLRSTRSHVPILPTLPLGPHQPLPVAEKPGHAGEPPEDEPLEGSRYARQVAVLQLPQETQSQRVLRHPLPVGLPRKVQPVPHFEHLPVVPRRPDLVDDSEALVSLVPEPVHLPGAHGGGLPRAEHELPPVHAETHPALPHAEGLREHRVPVGSGHDPGPRPHVLYHQVFAALVPAFFQVRHPVPVPVHQVAVPTGNRPRRPGARAQVTRLSHRLPPVSQVAFLYTIRYPVFYVKGRRKKRCFGDESWTAQPLEAAGGGLPRVGGAAARGTAGGRLRRSPARPLRRLPLPEG